jgi:hypothetical protein
VAKVDFKLNDSLLRRQPGARHASPSSEDVPAGKPRKPRRSSAPAKTDRATRESPRVEPEQPTAKRAQSVQTSLLLPGFLWDRLATLARETAGLATPNRLLVDILHARAAATKQEAAEDLEQFLSLPSEQTGVGSRWEERNLRLPAGLRDRLDWHRRMLASAGVRDATRAHLVAATIILRGPATAEQARELMAERRAEAFRRAVESQAR